MNRLVRKWQKSHGKKVYYLYDPVHKISACNMPSRRVAESEMKEGIKLQRKGLTK